MPWAAQRLPCFPPRACDEEDPVRYLPTHCNRPRGKVRTGHSRLHIHLPLWRSLSVLSSAPRTAEETREIEYSFPSLGRAAQAASGMSRQAFLTARNHRHIPAPKHKPYAKRRVSVEGQERRLQGALPQQQDITPDNTPGAEKS